MMSLDASVHEHHISLDSELFSVLAIGLKDSSWDSAVDEVVNLWLEWISRTGHNRRKEQVPSILLGRPFSPRRRRRFPPLLPHRRRLPRLELTRLSSFFSSSSFSYNQPYQDVLETIHRVAR